MKRFVISTLVGLSGSMAHAANIDCNVVAQMGPEVLEYVLSGKNKIEAQKVMVESHRKSYDSYAKNWLPKQQFDNYIKIDLQVIEDIYNNPSLVAKLSGDLRVLKRQGEMSDSAVNTCNRIMENPQAWGIQIPGIPKKQTTTAQKTPVPAAFTPTTAKNSLANGKVVFTLEGKDYTYKLIKLAPKDATKVFALMATQSAKTTQHPLNDNPLFQDVKIVQEKIDSMYQATSLVVGGRKLFTSSPDHDKLSYQMQGLSSLANQPELLLISVFEGGNSCDSQKQVLFSKGAKGYSATAAFGRCQVSWFDDKESGITYFAYPANESTPLEVMALTHTSH